MPLDEATLRLAFLLQRDMRRLVERERARTDRGELMRYDPVSRMATWETRRGDVIGRWYGETIATYSIRDRFLRWAWAGRSSISALTHAEVVTREGQSRGVPQLSMSVVGDLDEEEACTLARLGVLVARGEGMAIRRTDTKLDAGGRNTVSFEEEICFIGLFESPRPREVDVVDSSRYSVLPTVTSESSPHKSMSLSPSGAPKSSPHKSMSLSPSGAPKSSPPVASYPSLPPIREIYAPRSSKRVAAKTPPSDNDVREPARSIFLPVATAALADLTNSVPGYKQGLFVLTVESEIGAENSRKKFGVIVHLVANDAKGVLCALEPSRELVEAAARMVEADRNDGNGCWRKLSARITPKPDGGATLNVDVL